MEWSIPDWLGGAPQGAVGISAEPLPRDLVINELEMSLNISAECVQSDNGGREDIYQSKQARLAG